MFLVTENSFKYFILDPFGALWPFIGIVAEAVLLFFIIGGYELYKRKKKRKPVNGMVCSEI